jgi:hypothetical protein
LHPHKPHRQQSPTRSRLTCRTFIQVYPILSTQMSLHPLKTRQSQRHRPHQSQRTHLHRKNPNPHRAPSHRAHRPGRHQDDRPHRPGHRSRSRHRHLSLAGHRLRSKTRHPKSPGNRIPRQPIPFLIHRRLTRHPVSHLYNPSRQTPIVQRYPFTNRRQPLRQRRRHRPRSIRYLLILLCRSHPRPQLPYRLLRLARFRRSTRSRSHSLTLINRPVNRPDPIQILIQFPNPIPIQDHSRSRNPNRSHSHHRSPTRILRLSRSRHRSPIPIHSHSRILTPINRLTRIPILNHSHSHSPNLNPNPNHSRKRSHGNHLHPSTPTFRRSVHRPRVTLPHRSKSQCSLTRRLCPMSHKTL